MNLSGNPGLSDLKFQFDVKKCQLADLNRASVENIIYCFFYSQF
jgi:hypothetical protein